MAILTAKVHKREDLENEIKSLANENGKTIVLNENEVEQIRDESSVLVPLKKAVPSSKKDCKKL